jgi:hypothetical protein
MQKLGAQFNGSRELGNVKRPDPATDPVPRFQHRNVPSTRDKALRGRKTCNSRPDDDDVVALQART